MAPSRACSFLLILLLVLPALAPATGVFRVRRKFPRHAAGAAAEEAEGHLTALRRHDVRRHGRLLGSVDLPLGGIGLPTETGLYYTQLKIGSPAKGYYVQVDTGSDILWVKCIRCDGCPSRSGLAIELTQYDPAGSETTVGCDQEFCSAYYDGEPPCTSTSPCTFRITYGDGSSATGFFVSDVLQYDQVSGDGRTTPSNATVTFGCGAQLAGGLRSSSQALDGILGFGQSKSSMLSQLAAAKKVRKIFAHCLDTVRGGGIFAIGNVVQPKVKTTTPLVPNKSHYNVNLKAIAVGDATLQLPTNTSDTGESIDTIIDSGTTLTYLPDAVYMNLMATVFNKYQDMKFRKYQNFLCFEFSGNVDDGFPIVTFNFEGDLTLNVYPHEYLFQYERDFYCMGFVNGGLQTKDGKDMVLLGDLVLSNKLVVYDLENQVIGWTDYNCSSGIKIKDDNTGATYTVDAHDISSGCRFQWHKSLFLLLVTVMCGYVMF